MDLDLDHPPGPLAALLERAEDAGCVNLSELDAIARRLDFDDDDLPALHEAFEARGIDVSDDCGRAGVAPTSYANASSCPSVRVVVTTSQAGVFSFFRTWKSNRSAGSP